MLARLGFCICPLISIVGTAPVYATDIPALVQRARPAVVEILTFDQQNNLLKTGTGFFISQDGLLLTNFHVISGAISLMARTPTRTQIVVATPTGSVATSTQRPTPIGAKWKASSSRSICKDTCRQCGGQRYSETSVRSWNLV